MTRILTLGVYFYSFLLVNEFLVKSHILPLEFDNIFNELVIFKFLYMIWDVSNIRNLVIKPWHVNKSEKLLLLIKLKILYINLSGFADIGVMIDVKRLCSFVNELYQSAFLIHDYYALTHLIQKLVVAISKNTCFDIK